ncbi:MAG: DUF523 domain-containing protein [Ruminococcaceae bacterium]|nr:DUF523 domain-containing protein [Oscillospiraceae bacterium]
MSKSGKILVSACLLGENCKYNGGNNYSEAVVRFTEGKEVIPVCPERLAGLGIPRTPIEIRGDRVISRDGEDVTEKLQIAVKEILSQIDGEDIECAVLKSRSPTCGVRQVYDGSFTGTLTDGSGILARALIDSGLEVIDAEEV